MNGPRRWIGYVALVLVFAAACALLSWWQFSRNAEAQERIREVTDNWSATPVPVDRVLPSFGAPLDQRDTWTPMSLTGTYDTAHQLLVRGRPSPVTGGVGFEILVPLDLDGGGVVIVDRGWVPVGDTQADVPDSAPPAAPGGEVTVVAHVKVGEPGIPGRTAPQGQVATIELPLVAGLIGRDDVYTGAYGLLESETPSAPTGTLVPKPVPDPGPYLSYAIQWILFAIAAAIALIWSFRNERRVARMSVAERKVDAEERKERRRVRDKDAAAEDALLDA